MARCMKRTDARPGSEPPRLQRRRHRGAATAIPRCTPPPGAPATPSRRRIGSRSTGSPLPGTAGSRGARSAAGRCACPGRLGSIGWLPVTLWPGATVAYLCSRTGARSAPAVAGAREGTGSAWHPPRRLSGARRLEHPRRGSLQMMSVRRSGWSSSSSGTGETSLRR